MFCELLSRKMTRSAWFLVFKCFTQSVRGLRTRATPSQTRLRTYKLETLGPTRRWTALTKKENSRKFDEFQRLELLGHIRTAEVERMKELQQFSMPEINPGDLVEVRYELSRTQQTQAVFQGYCTEVRRQGLDSSFILKNTYDGVGVTQLVPQYSPRLLNVRVSKKVNRQLNFSKRPMTKDYRYKWHRNVRGKNEPKLLSGAQKPGIKSLEPRLQRKLAKIRSAYYTQRIMAGLPTYTYSNLHSIDHFNRQLEVRAEIRRRTMIYTHDAIRKLKARERRKREKIRWGTYKIARVKKSPLLSALPSYHPLLAGNLPK